MRNVIPLVLVAASLVLAGCRGSEPYSQEDLQQVRQVYAELRPIYDSFKHAFLTHQTAGVVSGYRQEHAPCKTVDEIDNRDTIDPNVALFQASITLDDMCNAIEAAYIDWAIAHHRPHPPDFEQLGPSEVFVGADTDLKKIKKYLSRPAALA